MGLFDFLKGGKSSKRSKGSSRKKKASSSSSGKPTRAEKSAANKKAWAEKQAGEKKARSSSKSSQSPSTGQTKNSISTARQWNPIAVRSGADSDTTDTGTETKKNERTATESGTSKSPRSKETAAPTANLTKAEKSAANKKAWAEKRAQEAAERKLQREREKLARSSLGKRRSAFNSAAEYGEYLKSEQWKTKRQRTKERAQGKCEICGKSGSDVHHRRYRSPGNEKSSDLMYVCRSCHKRVHGT